MNDPAFEESLNSDEAAAWGSFQNVGKIFLGNHRRIIAKNYKKLGYNMSLKIHFLDSDLNFLPSNLGSVSYEHRECFHQVYSPRMLADYC